ncbi:hypothetical protein FKM82_029040 [Ascaphus truei]
MHILYIVYCIFSVCLNMLKTSVSVYGVCVTLMLHVYIWCSVCVYIWEGRRKEGWKERGWEGGERENRGKGGERGWGNEEER